MKRIILLLLILTISTVALAQSVTFINPLGPTTIPIAPIMKGVITGNATINVKLWQSSDEAIAMIAAKQADFAVLPVTLGAILYSKGIKISLLGVYEWNVFYLVVSNNATFTGWKSLVGKAIYTPEGRGQTVDILMRYMMAQDGVMPDKDVKIYYLQPQEIVALFRSGKIDYAALPEPFVTMAISGGYGKIALDFQKAWGEEMHLPARIPIAGLFVMDNFAQLHPQTVTDVEQTFEKSIDWMNQNIDQALELSKSYLAIPIPILKESMQRTSFYYVPVSQCKADVETFLSKLNELYPEGMPSVPGDGFYGD
jgi:NitT/TauT family transport system substrate-binding protein